MTHISKRKLKSGIGAKLDRNLSAFLSYGNSSRRAAVLKEFLTTTERIMLGKRLLILVLLKRGASVYEIEKLLGISPSTVARFNLKFEQGSFAGASKSVETLFLQKGLGKILRDLETLFSIPFKARKMSFRQLISEIENS